MISITTTGLDQLAARFDAAPELLRQAIARRLQGLAERMQEAAREKLSGGVLQARSGALRDSIAYRLDVAGDSADLELFSDGVPYAGIQEYGGTTAPHVIYAERAKALMLAIGGKTVFARRVNHPGSRIPARSYLGSTIGDFAPEIAAEMTGALGDAGLAGG